jgi:hypothetical protein
VTEVTDYEAEANHGRLAPGRVWVRGRLTRRAPRNDTTGVQTVAEQTSAVAYERSRQSRCISHQRQPGQRPMPLSQSVGRHSGTLAHPERRQLRTRRTPSSAAPG